MSSTNVLPDRSFDPLRVSYEVARRQALQHAKPLCGTLMLDDSGAWLSEAVRQVQRVARSKPGRGGLIVDEPHEVRFRSNEPSHNVCERHEHLEATVFAVPAGSRLSKLDGSGIATWRFQLSNERAGDEHEHVDLRYDGERRLVLVRHFVAATKVATGRRAGQRFLGHGPDRSYVR